MAKLFSLSKNDVDQIAQRGVLLRGREVMNHVGGNQWFQVEDHQDISVVMDYVADVDKRQAPQARTLSRTGLSLWCLLSFLAGFFAAVMLGGVPW